MFGGSGPEAQVAKWSWLGVGFACIAAIFPTGPMWLFVPFILASLLCTGVGFFKIQGHFSDFDEASDLQDKWREQRRKAGLPCG